MSDAANPDPVALHNVLSGELVGTIVKLVLSNGGGPKDILVVLESVTLGICLFMERAGALLDEPDALVDEIAKGVKGRWAEQRAQRKREVH